MTDEETPIEDPRRWWTLGFALLSITIAVIDTTVLNVAVPTIRRELDTTLPAVQWVLTGYALVFASLLVVGGRLGDIFGPRRLVMVGAAIFGIGSFVASRSTSVGQLIVGEALIEGVGSALLTPNTLSLIANAFQGRARTTAFAAWATALSAGSIFGPVLGGYLTSYHSWRWAFRINLIIAPLVIIGLLITARPDVRRGPRPRLDIIGAVLVALGAFFVVFAISQGNTYGYGDAISAFSVLGRTLWPASAPISVAPVALALGILVIYVFARIEAAKERENRDPLFRMSKFRVRTFTIATVVGCMLAFSQLGMSYCVALYLQGSLDLSPVASGLWIAPASVAAVVGAPIGGWLARRMDATRVLRIGLVMHAGGMLAQAFLLAPSLTFWHVLPAFVVYGFGSGINMSQLNRVLLHDVDPAETGAASGMSTTARQTAAATGIAVNGAIFAAVTKHHGIDNALRPAMLVAFAALAIGVFATRWLKPIGSVAMNDSHELESMIESDAHRSGVELTIDRR